MHLGTYVVVCQIRRKRCSVRERERERERKIGTESRCASWVFKCALERGGKFGMQNECLNEKKCV